MRQVDISPEVAEILGSEQVARLSDATWDQRVQCWECDRYLPAGEPVSVLVVVPVDLPGPGQLYVVHAHPACSPSTVKRYTLAELKARAANRGGDETDRDTDVGAVALVWDTSRDAGYPALFLSYHGDVMFQAGPERVDGLVSGMLSLGWHLTSSLNTPPPTGPPGWAARFTHAEAHAAAPGVLQLADPHGEVVTEVTVQPPRLWRPALLHTGHVAVFHGSLYLRDWQTRGRSVLKQAAHEGRLVGGIVPATLDGPGNAGYPARPARST